ncbi:hypothetical protein BV25DRAFT_1829418 [Artomyces pyxidatus]|uniref:Uncharacterized protein n=1 Tax=Artomyces pyxidatus TaxID=48021 RepID=A0ACB8SRM8_9AGAM|nr:hypothetical protein BV25DRAFT_1829418 [Artomyces pyxidatus]
MARGALIGNFAVPALWFARPIRTQAQANIFPRVGEIDNSLSVASLLKGIRSRFTCLPSTVAAVLRSRDPCCTIPACSAESFRFRRNNELSPAPASSQRVVIAREKRFTGHDPGMITDPFRLSTHGLMVAIHRPPKYLRVRDEQALSTKYSLVPGRKGNIR